VAAAGGLGVRHARRRRGEGAGARGRGGRLPTLDGQFRNAGYALQWWAFAAFALVMSVLIARNYRRRGMQLSDGD
jgi:surfeit locus 1 family protein